MNTLAHGLAERGHKIFVIFPRPAVNGTTAVTLSHVRPRVDAYCIWLPAGDGYEKGFNEMLVLVARQIIESGRAVDVIHCHSNHCLPAIRSLSEAYTIPVVSTVHAIHVPMVYEVKRKKGVAVSSGEEKQYLQNVSRTSALCCSSERIVAVSQAMTRLIQKYYRVHAEKLCLVHNGVDVKKLVAPRDDNQVNRLKSKLGLKGRVVLFSGRMEPIKGVCRFAEAVKEVCRENRNVSVVLLGNGSADRWLRSYLNSLANVHFVDWMPWDQTIAFYHLADIVVVPSLIEPFGLVAVEAMACRNCVIVSEADGLDEIVSDGVNGLKVPLFVDRVGDRDISAQEIRDRLVWALEEDGERDELAESGISRAWEFSCDRMAKGVEAVYSEAAGTHGHRVGG
ncbi:MAG: glycosyltransferase family 4 protein [Deltaproteobacteria bacterium]|nr:glycosyltransferase family 4 protein [Deltaproteobacteria bacterium]